MEQTYNATMSGIEGDLDSFHTIIARLQGILIDVKIVFRLEISLEKGGLPQTWVSNKQDYFLFPRGRYYSRWGWCYKWHCSDSSKIIFVKFWRVRTVFQWWYMEARHRVIFMPRKFKEKFLSTNIDKKRALLSINWVRTSGVQKVRPTFWAHLRSVLAKSAFEFVYWRPAASPTKYDSALSELKPWAHSSMSLEMSESPICTPSPRYIFSISFHIPGIGFRYLSFRVATNSRKGTSFN